MAQHKSFTVDTEVKVYFCDPQSPWQRGSNENTKGLLRQYFPKRTDLSVHSQEDLDKVALLLNQRPRKTLGFQTPADKLQASVALTHSDRPVYQALENRFSTIAIFETYARIITFQGFTPPMRSYSDRLIDLTFNSGIRDSGTVQRDSVKARQFSSSLISMRRSVLFQRSRTTNMLANKAVAASSGELVTIPAPPRNA
jgi:type IV secretory pathway ATPase VirB11/archaellum biosynthesis ATPase